MAEAFSITALGHRLEAEWHGSKPDEAPTLVLLHEGLGSVAGWRDFPAELAQASGLGVFVYSRVGYGKSDPIVPPRPLRYMHDEALLALPEVMDAAGVRDAVLVGHSDGASIAIIHAGSDIAGKRAHGLALLAPHVFCEDVSVESIEKARDAFRDGDLRERLQKTQGDNVDGAFWGWNRAWLDPEFRNWNIEEYLPNIRVPVSVIQGKDDPYGTPAQIDAIERGVKGPFRRSLLPRVGHAPQRDAPKETLYAVVALAQFSLKNR